MHGWEAEIQRERKRADKMKVLMVNKFLYPNGGSETYIFRLGEELTRLGNEVQYFGMEHEGRIVGNRAGCYTSDMDFHGGGLQKLVYPFKIIYSVEARRKIRRVLEDFQPDVVHLNNFNFQLTPSILYEINRYSRKRKKIRIVFTAHDCQLVCPNHLMRIPATGENCERCIDGKFGNCIRHRCIHNSLVKSILGSMEGYLYRILKTYRLIDCVICPSYFMEKRMEKVPGFQGKTVVMHNFVDAAEKKTARKRITYFILEGFRKKRVSVPCFPHAGSCRKFHLYLPVTGRWRRKSILYQMLKMWDS